MARRVHLHIGTMKSATTYLQDLCELHADHLADSGVLWLPGSIRYAGIRAFFGRADDQTDQPAAWRSLLQQIRGHPGDVVLSNELLAGLECHRIHRLVDALGPSDVQVVITARDPVRVIPSAWQTAIRSGEKTYPWAEFSSAVCSDPSEVDPTSLHEKFWHQHDVARVALRWQPLIADGHLTVVTVPPIGGDRQAVAYRFGAAIGVDLTGLTQPTTRGNSTLGAHSAELMRRVNIAVSGADRAIRKYGIRNALADAGLGARAKLEPEFGLSPAQHAWAEGRARRMVDELSSMGLVIQGDLTDLIPTGQHSADFVDPAASTDAELLEASTDGLIGMARHATRQRLQRNELRAEVERLTAERDALLNERAIRTLVRRARGGRSRLS
jgi:hypothetical protein